MFCVRLFMNKVFSFVWCEGLVSVEYYISDEMNYLNIFIHQKSLVAHCKQMVGIKLQFLIIDAKFEVKHLLNLEGSLLQIHDQFCN